MGRPRTPARKRLTNAVRVHLNDEDYNDLLDFADEDGIPYATFARLAIKKELALRLAKRSSATVSGLAAQR